MATDSARLPARPGRRYARTLWQWPTFLAGTAVFAAAWADAIPVPPPDPFAAARDDLAAFRSLAESRNPDPAALRDRAKGFDAGHAPEQALAHFVLGTGHVRLAELATDPAAGKEAWALARQNLEKVTPDQLPDDDRPRLAYRLAKARAGCGFPPATPAADLAAVVAQLSTVPAGEAPGEGNRLVAELCLRLNPPDAARAKALFTLYLTDAGLSTPAASLARARLALGTLLQDGGDPDGARKWLSQVGPDAPADVLAPAKGRLARLLMAENAWDLAAAEWEYVRASAAVPTPEKLTATYYLGVCKLMARRPDAAAGLFGEAARADGPEGFAAVVKLTDLTLRGPDAAAHRAAVTRLVSAVATLPPGKEVGNALVPAQEVRAAFEQAVQVLRADGAFDAAVQAADAYGTVAAVGRAPDVRAELLAAWAADLQARGGDFKGKAKEAADAFEALARDQAAAPAAHAALTRRAAGLFRLADDATSAAAALGRLAARTDVPPDATGAVWADYGEALVATGKPEEAVAALNRAMASSGPVGTAVRYKLARRFADSKNPGLVALGSDLLTQVAQSTAVDPADQEVQERALVDLGQDALRQGRFAEAQTWFGKQLGSYANGPEAALGKFLLGVTLLQQTAKTAGGAEAADANKRREEALKLFDEVAAGVDAKGKAATERDGWLRTQSALRVLQAYQQMGKPDEVVFRGSKLLEKTRGQVEELIVLSMMYHAHKQSDRPELAVAALDRMKEAFKALPDDAFKGGTGEYSRAYWDTVWVNPPAAGGTPPAP